MGLDYISYLMNKHYNFPTCFIILLSFVLISPSYKDVLLKYNLSKFRLVTSSYVRLGNEFKTTQNVTVKMKTAETITNDNSFIYCDVCIYNCG